MTNQKIQSIIKTTRAGMKLNLRQFAVAVGRSRALVNFWELGRYTPSYVEMYYLYTHTSQAPLRSMAAAVMRELDTDRWALDTSNNGGIERGNSIPLYSETATAA